MVASQTRGSFAPVLTASVGAASRASATAGPAAIGGAGLLLVAWAFFFGGGSGDARLVWLGSLALLVAAAALAAALFGVLPLPWPGPPAVAFFASLGGLVVWCGASIGWSIQPDRSWSYANRGLVYLAFACIGLFVGALVPQAPRRVAAGLASVLGAVLAWALLGKIVPALFPDGARIARLRNPVGYWNGLALLADAALPLGLWISARREHRPSLRGAGVLLLYAASVALVLTYSRAGVLLGAIVVVVWLACSRERLEGMAALACSLPLAAVVSGLATAFPGVADNGEPHDVRVRDGAYFGLMLVLGAVLAYAAATWLVTRERRRPLSPDRRAALLRLVLAGAGAVVVVTVVVLLVRAGGPGPWLDRRLDDFTSVQVQPTQGPGRVSSFSSGNRWTWWKEAWNAFENHPLDGTGAGSFALVHRAQRDSSLDVATEPHNVLLQFLAETGLIGFGLAIGLGVAAVLGVRLSLRRLVEPDRAAGVALAIGVIAYALHALVDFDWDFVAVSGPTLFVVGVLLGAGWPVVTIRPRQTLWALGAVAVALAGVFSLVSPWLAERRIDDGLEALGRRDVPSAIAAWRDAHALNPLADKPLLLWASTEAAVGNIPGAKEVYRQAVDLQPHDPEAWYQFGRFELDQDCYPALAYEYLNRSYTLDRFGPATDGSLDRARNLVNRAATAPRRGRGARPACPSS
jgi:hypothetical protein